MCSSINCDYINWLTTSYTNKQLFFNLLQCNNSICPNLSCLVIFIIRWWLTNNQWCNLTLSRPFWATKVCLRASKIPKICLFGCLTEWTTFWKANFKNYSRYFFDKMVSIFIQHDQYSMSKTLFRFRQWFCCLLVPLKVMPRHGRVCLIIGLTINAIV